MSTEVQNKVQENSKPLDLDEDLSAQKEDGEEEMTTNYHERIESFDNMGLKEELLRGIYSFVLIFICRSTIFIFVPNA
jgi:hypothetical protein